MRPAPDHPGSPSEPPTPHVAGSPKWGHRGRTDARRTSLAAPTSLDSTKLSPHNGCNPASFTYDPPGDQCRCPVATTAEASFRHSGWAPTRQRVWKALTDLRVSRTRLDRFAQCGAGCHVECSPSTGRFRLSAHYCRDRLCQPCGMARSAVVTRNVSRHSKGRDCRFYTFTLKHSETPLADQIDRLYRSFAAWRRRDVVKSRVTGGVAILEVKLGRDGSWHPHLHCIIEGSFFPQRELSDTWLRVTGDSYIVHLKALSNDQREVRYATAYAGKPLDASVCRTPERLAEAAAALRGRRITFTFGTWRGLDLDAPDADAPTDWISLGTLADLLDDARRGDRSAIHLIDQLLRRDARAADDARGPPVEP